MIIFNDFRRLAVVTKRSILDVAAVLDPPLVHIKTSHPYCSEFSSYLPMEAVPFLEDRLLFNIFYCFCMFVNNYLINFGCVYLKE